MLRFAKVPYKVHTDKQSAFGPVAQDYKDGAKKQVQSLATSESMTNTFTVLGIAKPQLALKENKYELISCGDYNSYAILNI